MDGTSPKGEQLVGVRQQAIAAGNNAIYDITNASIYTVGFVKTSQNVYKSYHQNLFFSQAYERAIGKSNMKSIVFILETYLCITSVSRFRQKWMIQKAYLEQNIQIALSQKEIDLKMLWLLDS